MALVAHLTTAHQPRDNRIFNKEASALAASGFDVVLIARGVGSDPVNGVQMVELPVTRGRLQRVVRGQLNAWRALGRVRPGLVHTHDPELIPLAWLWARTHRAAFIYDAHEDLVGQIDDKSYLPGPLKGMARLVARLLLKLADKGADAIVTATPVIAATFTHPRTVVVRNFPWLRDFPVVERHEVEGRVVYIGGLTQGRQSDVMMAAVEAVPRASLEMAGPPDAFTQRLIDALPQDSSITHVGVVSPQEIPGKLATAAVGLVFLMPLPNYLESLPTKLFEYMAAGIPFIASDFPYWRQMLDQFDAGVFVDTTTPEAPSAALNALLSDQERRHQMGIRGRRAIEQVFNFEADVPVLVKVTRDALDRRSR
ncbi:glycosyltransferase [Aestuariimicrobium ganziense]|uniref:glycosyltransferase n=1 Tax=Aestuariimicrobium ganziense TaxID=2773677 RepID=UPI001941B693|nr:glycosyltransferase [Aestuariimicrobium ganziense]